MNEKSKYAILRAYDKGYRVADDGTLTNAKGETLRCSMLNTGYPYFAVSLGPKPPRQRKGLLHVYVAYCWFGKVVLDAECVRHLNDVRTDCRRDNIAYGTRVDNARDIPAEKRLRIGRKANAASAARGAEARAARDREIVRAYQKAPSVTRLVRRFKVSRGTIKQVLRKAVASGALRFRWNNQFTKRPV